MSEELVTIATFNHPADCEVIRARLESEGIISFAFNEKTIQVDPLLSAALGGVMLKVGKEDAEKAMEILKQPVEVDEEYKEFFKETPEDIIFKKEQVETQKRTQNFMKWGCLGVIIALVLGIIISSLLSR
jgi:hypothetical protein